MSDPILDPPSSPVGHPPLPVDLADAQIQAIASLQAGLAAGYPRLQVDILAPDLKPHTLTWPFLTAMPHPLVVVMPDAGAAALTQREWKESGIPEGVSIQGLGILTRIEPQTAVLFALPNVVSVDQVEQLCAQVDPQQPIVLLNPQLQDAATVGIGLTGRRLRERFIRTFEPVYYLQSLGNAALTRFYPHPWILWQLNELDEYEEVERFSRKPSGEELAGVMAQSTGSQPSPWAGLRRFVQSLMR